MYRDVHLTLVKRLLADNGRLLAIIFSMPTCLLVVRSQTAVGCWKRNLESRNAEVLNGLGTHDFNDPLLTP